MKCPVCEAEKTSRLTQDYISTEHCDYALRRLRKCPHGHTFYTYECYEIADVEVVFKAREAMSFLDKARAELLRIPDLLSTVP